MQNGALYFIVHESDVRTDTYDITLESAIGNELTMNLKDLSPVTIAKISFVDGTVIADDEDESTDTITSQNVTGEEKSSSPLRIIFMILGIIAIVGAGALFIVSRQRREHVKVS